MAKSRFENAEQWNTKREIDRINRQIKQAYTKFGADSRLARQYQTILQGSETRILQDSLATQHALNMRTGLTEPIIRYTKDGIPQISTGKATLSEFTRISSMQKQLENLGRMQTVQSAQRHMIDAYKERKGIEEIKTRQEKQFAIEKELERYRESENFRQNYLNQLYEYERKHGVKLQALQEIREKSKGRWTSYETLDEMKDLAMKAQKEIQAEKAKIIDDVFSKNQW